MLKVRVIPSMLWKKFGLVKGVNFKSDRKVGPLLPTLRVYNSRNIDELILFDVDRDANNNIIDYETIFDCGSECSIPLTVGGKITNIEHVSKLLSVGADKVCVNTAVYEDQNLIPNIAKLYGTQCVVASADVRMNSPGYWECYSHCGKKRESLSIVEWAKIVEGSGAGEILITSIDRDGTMSGYDLSLIELVVTTVKIPVIASGGAGSYKDLVDAIKLAGASAVAAASIFHFTELTPEGVKNALANEGIPVRTVQNSNHIKNL